MNQTNQQLYLCYGDIIAGFSIFEVEDETFYAKHLNILDLILLENKTKDIKEKNLNKNLKSEKEKLQFLNSSGEWTDENEKEHQEDSIKIKNLEKSLEKIFIKSQKSSLEKELKTKSKSHGEKTKTRQSLIGQTLDAFLEKRKNEESIRLSLFKDPDLKNLSFEEEEFSEMDDEVFSQIIFKYNEVMEKFSDENIKKIAVSGFFLNPFFLSKDNCYNFYGKRIIDLSFFQQNLFSKGILYKSVLSQGKNPPETFYEDIEKLVTWFDSVVGDSSSSSKKDKPKTFFNKSNRQVASSVGASKEELEAMAAKEGGKVINLAQEIRNYKKELGKDVLSTMDVIKLHERLGI